MLSKLPFNNVYIYLTIYLLYFLHVHWNLEIHLELVPNVKLSSYFTVASQTSFSKPDKFFQRPVFGPVCSESELDYIFHW